MTEKFDNIKVGDSIYSELFGVGVVKEINPEQTYPIRIKFPIYFDEAYKSTGQYYQYYDYCSVDSIDRDLFWTRQDYLDRKNGHPPWNPNQEDKGEPDYEAEFNEHFKGLKK